MYNKNIITSIINIDNKIEKLQEFIEYGRICILSKIFDY